MASSFLRGRCWRLRYAPQRPMPAHHAVVTPTRVCPRSPPLGFLHGSAREVLTWSDFGVASRDLATQIVADGFGADIVVAVARGGLVPAGALAYALGPKLPAR